MACEPDVCASTLLERPPGPAPSALAREDAWGWVGLFLGIVELFEQVRECFVDF